MTNHPYEPQPPGPFEAGPMLRVLRTQGSSLPPGPGHHFDRKHFRRQTWIGYLFVAGVVFFAVYTIAVFFGWLPYSL